jgi:hypothetical protein
VKFFGYFNLPNVEKPCVDAIAEKDKDMHKANAKQKIRCRIAHPFLELLELGLLYSSSKVCSR